MPDRPILDRLTTEQPNPAAEDVDQLSTLDIVRLINREDCTVADAVGREAAQIARAVDMIAKSFQRGGRLIYLGAGTSGRLGVLDASECPPTFSTDPEQVVGLIAGGPNALVRSIEGAEDNPAAGARDLDDIRLTSHDVVVGIATSGRTPYVLGGLEHARTIGCQTIGLACNAESQLESVVDLLICPVVGPEIISGSTRMKAGTATKMVLNSLTTAAMIRLGKTYGNLMVDLRATNSKLRDRALRIVKMITNADEQTALALLDTCDGEVKTAIVVQRGNLTADQARRLLSDCGGQLRRALEQLS